jgi:hypothetical protein
MKTTNTTSFSIPLEVIARLQALADRLYRGKKIRKNSTSQAVSHVLEQEIARMDEPPTAIPENEHPRAQVDMERWARIKHRIDEGRCIGCGGESNLKLYIHFCDNCLKQAGVKVEFVENGEEESSPPILSDRDQRWLRFIEKLLRPDEQEGQDGQRL